MHIKMLHDIHGGDQHLVGGKAASLGTLSVAGIPVPKGFVVTTHVTVDKLNSPLLQAEILRAFRELDAPYVAVRSSAVGEDSLTTSWAGQLETFLNVNEGNLLSCIKKCFQSTSSDRARAYAAHHQITVGNVAVLVQAMIQSEVSGVAFSVHPVTQNTQQVVIEAGLGLGEAIVSGEITPDTYILDKNTGECIEKHISQQDRMIIKKDMQNSWVSSGEKGSAQKLRDRDLVTLMSIITQIEKLQGVPIDVEWAIAGGVLQILQARPITTIQ